jgi:hypothetical protein
VARGQALQREMRALTVPASTSTVASAETTAASWEEKPAKKREQGCDVVSAQTSNRASNRRFADGAQRHSDVKP